MPQEILNIILSAIGIIITGLATFCVTRITAWLDAKISDKKAANYLSTITTIVGDCVNETYQTYVQAIKETGKFDEEAQKYALSSCLAKITNQLAPEVLDYIIKNFGDVTVYLTTLIESTIYKVKVWTKED